MRRRTSFKMEHSRVYLRLHFLLYLKDTSVEERQTALMNITPGQLKAIGEVVSRVLQGVMSLMRRDVQLFQRKRTVLRTVVSPNVTFARKKALLRRHHSLIPRLLRAPYLIQTILHEIRETRET